MNLCACQVNTEVHRTQVRVNRTWNRNGSRRRYWSSELISYWLVSDALIRWCYSRPLTFWRDLVFGLRWNFNSDIFDSDAMAQVCRVVFQSILGKILLAPPEKLQRHELIVNILAALTHFSDWHFSWRFSCCLQQSVLQIYFQNESVWSESLLSHTSFTPLMFMTPVEHL